MMIFVIPHNFLAPIVPKMNAKFAPGACGCSLIKGIEFDDGKPILISDLLQAEMKKAESTRARPSPTAHVVRAPMPCMWWYARSHTL